MTITPTYEIKYDQVLDISTGDITNGELEELRLMQEIVDGCPSMEKEIFGKSKLGNRYHKLQEKKLLGDMSSITAIMAKEICNQIDADILKSMGECFVNSATNPVNIDKLEELLGIKDAGIISTLGV